MVRRKESERCDVLSPGVDETLVGREAEITRIAGVVRPPAAGPCVEIAGDPGIGETSLLSVPAEFAGGQDAPLARALLPLPRRASTLADREGGIRWAIPSKTTPAKPWSPAWN